MRPSLDPRWDRRSADEIRAGQDRRLRQFIREQVAPFSPFYRKLFAQAGVDPSSIRGVDDLEKIPFTSKEDIAPSAGDPNRPRDLILAPTRELLRGWPLRRKAPLALQRLLRGATAVTDGLAREYRPVSVFFTTGRSALPTAFVLSRYDLAILEEVGRRILAITGIDAGSEKVVNLFPFAPHLAFWQVHAAGIGATCFVLNTGGGKVLGTEGILQAIEKIRPAYVVGIPGYVYHLLREAHHRGMDLSFVRGLALGGDQANPAFRGRVRDLLVRMGATPPVRVLSVLGFTEARKCWTECQGEDAAGFHTYPDFEVMEVVDPQTGRRKAEGETGELVYTCLDGRGSVVLRYRTGDLIVGGMTTAVCPHCGRTVPRLSSHLDRVSNLRSFQLSKIKGTLVNLNALKDELEADPRIEEWQLVIKKKNDDPFDLDELQLNLALSAGLEARGKEVVEDVERKVFRVAEVALNTVKVLPLKDLLDLLGMETQLKEKRIVDLRSGSPGPRGAPRGDESGSGTRGRPVPAK